jgi:hypothetical protein
MSSPNPREIRYDIFAARALHDAKFQEILRTFGVSPEGSVREVRERLAGLDNREFRELMTKVQESDILDLQADRNEQVVHELNELSASLWEREKRTLMTEAKRIMEGPVKRAREELTKGNPDGFRDRLPEIKEHVKAFSAEIRDAHHRVGDELRNYLYTASVDMSKAERKTMIDEKILDHNIPPAMQKVLALENTLAQEEVDYVMKQEHVAEHSKQITPGTALTPGR